MAYTQADVDRLKKAIATGARRVTDPQGGTVEYRSFDEMLQALELMTVEVANAGGTPRRRARVVRVGAASGY